MWRLCSSALVWKIWRAVSQSAPLGGWRSPWTSGLSVEMVQICSRAASSCVRAGGCPQCLSTSLGLPPGFSNSHIQSPATENVPLHAGCCVYLMSCSCSLLSHQNKIYCQLVFHTLSSCSAPQSSSRFTQGRESNSTATGKHSRECFKEAADAELSPLPKQLSLSKSWYCLEIRNVWLSPH